MLVWKFIVDELTQEYKNMRNYQNFKSGTRIYWNNYNFKGKKLKISDTQYAVINPEEEKENEEETLEPFLSEKTATKGRFILATKHEISKQTKVK